MMSGRGFLPVIMLILVAGKLPLLNLGYGCDWDAWGIAQNARLIYKTHSADVWLVLCGY